MQTLPRLLSRYQGSPSDYQSSRREQALLPSYPKADAGCGNLLALSSPPLLGAGSCDFLRASYFFAALTHSVTPTMWIKFSPLRGTRLLGTRRLR